MASAQKIGVLAPDRSVASQPQPANPEVQADLKTRKRLAKAFSRPLEKKHKGIEAVREKFSIPENEYTLLLELKRHLAGQGMVVKKSELLRAGLLMLAELSDDELKVRLAKVSAAG